MPLLRVYVETSVWSFAFADDAPTYRGDTLEFFAQCRARVVQPFISTVVLEEIERARQPRYTELRDLVREIDPTVVALPPSAEMLADAFVREGVVPPGKPEDARHVAAAFVEELDVLASWNFRHIVNVRRADRFNAVAVLAGFVRPLRIVSPTEVIYGENDEAD